MKIAVDIGGSGVRFRSHCRNWDGYLISHTECFKPRSFDAFCECIDVMIKTSSGADSQLEGMAISVCGEYDYTNEKLISCFHHRYLLDTPKLKKSLINRFKCENIRILNDGDAHAWTLYNNYLRRSGESAAGGNVVNLAIGTGVGFGVVRPDGNIEHDANGHNYEVWNWKYNDKGVGPAIGTDGLKKLEEKYDGGPEAFRYFGGRICRVLATAIVPKFKPKIVGLSGGVIANHSFCIREGMEEERKRWHELDGVEFRYVTDENSVLSGMVGLL